MSTGKKVIIGSVVVLVLGGAVAGNVWLKREPEQRVAALCYMVDRGHVQYAGRLTLEQQLHHGRQGHGQSGNNLDYVIATVGALEELGYRETELHLLAERLKGVHETHGPSPASP